MLKAVIQHASDVDKVRQNRTLLPEQVAQWANELKYEVAATPQEEKEEKAICQA